MRRGKEITGVLTVFHLIEGLGRGGAERRLINDLKYLDRSRICSVVCTLRPPHDLANEVEAQHVPVHCLDTWSSWSPLKPLSRLISLMRQYQVDILHTQIFAADIYGRLARLLSRQFILVSTLQSSAYEPGTEYLNSAKRRLVDSLTGVWCNDAFVAVSAFVKDSAVRNLGFPEDKITIIPNSVDIEEFPEIDLQVAARKRKELGISPQDQVVLTVGRLDPPKGHRFLLESLAEVKRFFPAVKLLIVGDGPSRSSLESLSQQMGIADHVVFSGVRQDVKEILSLCDLFVLPTLSEGLPVALLEAMALKRACVASRIPPVEEVIQDGVSGFLVPPRCPASLAEAIIRLLRNPQQREEVGIRAWETVRERFSARKNTQSLQLLYERLAENHKD